MIRLYLRLCITCHVEFLAGRTANLCSSRNADRKQKFDRYQYQ